MARHVRTYTGSLQKLTTEYQPIANAHARYFVDGLARTKSSLRQNIEEKSDKFDQHLRPTPPPIPSTQKRVIRNKQQQHPEKPSGMESGWGGALGLGSVANLGSFVELYEVQVTVVAMIYLDLVASTAQLLPYLQVAEDEEEGGAGRVEGVAIGSNGASFGAFVVRLVSRLMQVSLASGSALPSVCFFVITACYKVDRKKKTNALTHSAPPLLPQTTCSKHAAAVLHGVHRDIFRDGGDGATGRFPREVLPAPGLRCRPLGGLSMPLSGAGRQGER